jgi:hypothetical protein
MDDKGWIPAHLDDLRDEVDAIRDEYERFLRIQRFALCECEDGSLPN